MQEVDIVDITPLRKGNFDPIVDEAILNALKRDFFVGISGYNPKFDELNARLRELWREMVDQPELFQKYDGRDTFYQRGTRAGITRLGEVKIQDPFRLQIMLGPKLDEDNPINAFHPQNAHLPNPVITEIPDLVPTAEAYLELQGEHDRLIAESLERSMSLPKGFYAARLTWGNSVWRALDYRVKGVIKDKRIINGVDVRGKVVNGINVYDIETKGELVKNVVLISPHDDVDFWADLIKLRGTLKVRRRDGTVLEYSGKSGVKLLNTGIQASLASAYMEDGKRESHFDGGVHWAEIETAEIEDRIDDRAQSIVVFSHPRYTSPISALDRMVDSIERPSYTNVILRDVLVRRSHDPDPKALSKLEASLQKERRLAEGPLSDRNMVEKILGYEHDKGIVKLRRYESELPQLMDLWTEGHRK